MPELGCPMREIEPANAGAHWAAQAHERPPQVWEEWASDLAVALLPAGRRWDAVAMSSLRMQAVAEVLGQDLAQVPVLTDLTVDRAYVFVPAGTAETWSEPDTTPIGADYWLVASKPGGRQVPAGTWLQAPDLITRLADPAVLRAALKRTTENL
ncbi:hypothetical protein ACE1OC_41170 [Streptomyces sp. DSM 116496]|uniref:hypothetical protein n=1 Tax=Streptomyces stoeckheimensis TaxID=3344656 RepID=UPI0038B23DA4